MHYSFFLTVVLSTFTLLASAQSTVRGGAQPSSSPSAVPAKTSTSPSSVNTRSDAGKQGTTGTVRKTESKPATVTSREPSKTATKTTPRSTGAATKAPATIPAVTTRGSSNKPVTVKQQPVVPQASIKWLTIEEALEKSKTEKRKIYVDVYTDWCGWCKHMDSTTFRDQSIVNYINEKYYPVKFNAEQTGDVQYKGKNYKFNKQGARGHHELAALWLNNRLSYPTSVVLNEDQDLIQPIPGFLDSKKMDAVLHYFGTDNHKKTPWEKYEKNYAKEKK